MIPITHESFVSIISYIKYKHTVHNITEYIMNNNMFYGLDTGDTKKTTTKKVVTKYITKQQRFEIKCAYMTEQLWISCSKFDKRAPNARELVELQMEIEDLRKEYWNTK